MSSCSLLENVRNQCCQCSLISGILYFSEYMKIALLNHGVRFAVLRRVDFKEQ